MLTFLLGFTIGAGLIAWFAVTSSGHQKRIQAARLSAYLEVLRRELANELIARDPEAFRQEFHGLNARLGDLRKLSAGERQARLKVLNARLSTLADFDVLKVKDFVLVADASAYKSFQELSAAYGDLIEYCELTPSLGFSGKFDPGAERELRFVDGYIGRVRDTLLKDRILRAHQEIENHQNYVSKLFAVEGFSKAWEAATEEVYGFQVYETPGFIADERLPGAETIWGICLRNPEGPEYGALSLGRDMRGRPQATAFRTDIEYRERESLDPLKVPHLPITPVGYSGRKD